MNTDSTLSRDKVLAQQATRNRLYQIINGLGEERILASCQRMTNEQLFAYFLSSPAASTAIIGSARFILFTLITESLSDKDVTKACNRFTPAQFYTYFANSSVARRKLLGIKAMKQKFYTLITTQLNDNEVETACNYLTDAQFDACFMSSTAARDKILSIDAPSTKLYTLITNGQNADAIRLTKHMDGTQIQAYAASSAPARAKVNSIPAIQRRLATEAV